MTEPDTAIIPHKFDLFRLTDATTKAPPLEISVVATPAQCSALAQDFGILGIGALTGLFRLRRGANGLVLATLDIEALVTQACIVTTDPVEQRITERASLLLLTTAQAEARDLANAPIDPDEPDEIIANGSIVDLGAVLIEQLALAIDPYPRKPDAAIPDHPLPGDDAADSDSAQRPNPFAALAKLRKN